jgi:OPA family glycerol-3-phosphate transporter-like MFS transporter
MKPRGISPGGVVALLVIGYSGYYLCRSNYSVAKPLLLDAFPALDKEALGLIASIGTLFYAAGKFFHGAMADRFGGRSLFLYGMAGSIAAVVAFALGGPPIFLTAWALNRFVQSAGWGGMVRIVGHWFKADRYGRIMGFVSLSYLFGDFVSRLLLGQVVRLGADWSQLFLFSAIGLALILVPTAILLRERPAVSLPESPGVPDGPPPSASEVLFRVPLFWSVCALSFVFTLLRESFNEWTPLYLREIAKLSAADAASASSLFPLFGGLSVLAVGYYSDRIAKNGIAHRLKVVPFGLLAGAFGLGVLAFGTSLTPALIVGLVAFVAFALIGPYSLLAGAISLDFGGAKRSATAAGWIDGIGYLGGILSGYGIASIVQSMGWNVAMGTLGALCLLTALSLPLMLPKKAGKLRNGI